MTTYPMHFTDNANSWCRIALLAKFYWPCLRPGFIIMAIAPAVLMFISAGIGRLTGDLLDSLLVWPISILLYLSPIMLTKRDYRSIGAQLPVTATEKLGFLLLTFLLAVPLVVFLSECVGQLLSIGVFGSDVETLLKAFEERSTQVLKGFEGSIVWIAKASSILSISCVIVIVLYYVVTAKKNRALAGIIASIVINVASGVIAGIIGAIVGIVHAVQSDDELSEEAVQHIVLDISTVVILASAAILAIIAIIYLTKLYKRLRNSGF